MLWAVRSRTILRRRLPFYCMFLLCVLINSHVGSIQGLGLFVSMIVCYLVLARTWYFEAGLFGLVVSKFRGIFWLVPINFLLTMGMRGYYVVREIFSLSSDQKFELTRWYLGHGFV